MSYVPHRPPRPCPAAPLYCPYLAAALREMLAEELITVEDVPRMFPSSRVR